MWRARAIRTNLVKFIIIQLRSPNWRKVKPNDFAVCYVKDLDAFVGVAKVIKIEKVSYRS
jgi:hypothetical protein